MDNSYRSPDSPETVTIVTIAALPSLFLCWEQHDEENGVD